MHISEPITFKHYANSYFFQMGFSRQCSLLVYKRFLYLFFKSVFLLKFFFFGFVFSVLLGVLNQPLGDGKLDSLPPLAITESNLL